MHDSARVFSPKSQAARAVNREGCMTTEEVAEYCHLTVEGAFVILMQIYREGRISRSCGVPVMWLPRIARPRDDDQMYAARSDQARRASVARWGKKECVR